MDLLRDYWQILGSVLMFVIGYFRLRYDVEAAQKDIIGMKVSIGTLQENNQEIREILAAIREQINSTGHNINDIRRTLDRLDERLHK